MYEEIDILTYNSLKLWWRWRELNLLYTRLLSNFYGEVWSFGRVFDCNILTEIADEDRQILVTVVNRWKRLSDELKKVVLAVTDIA